MNIDVLSTKRWEVFATLELKLHARCKVYNLEAKEKALTTCVAGPLSPPSKGDSHISLEDLAENALGKQPPRFSTRLELT